MITTTAGQLGAGGGNSTANVLEAGTYPCTLTAAEMYKNFKYQSEEETTQITLIWDTGHTVESESGEDIPVYIYDSFINWTFNEKAKLTERLTALGFTGVNAKTPIGIDLGGLKSFDELENIRNGREARKSVEAWEVNGENVFGREALITIDINDKGYPRVKQVSAPIKQPAGNKLKARTAINEAPAGAPL